MLLYKYFGKINSVRRTELLAMFRRIVFMFCSIRVQNHCLGSEMLDLIFHL